MANTLSNFIRLSRILSASEIYHQVLNINIQALGKLASDEDHDWGEWDLLVSNYQSSSEEMKANANLIKSILEAEYNKPGISREFLHKLPLNWLNTLKSTLYMMEEDLIVNSTQGVFELWDIFFEVDEYRELTYSKKLNLKILYYGN